MAFDSNKISNIIGTKLPQWLIDQLDTRSNQGARESRDNDNILFVANKTAWIRLVSSIDIVNPNDIEYFKKVVGDSIRNKEDLAKQFVLFGGTSKYLRENSYQQRSGIGKDGAYGILGTNEIQQFGYRPMPGIQSVTIDTQGKLGSLRAATINFKCWDKSQLDIIDALYFKLGFTMFLEWGQTFFYPRESNRVQSTELYSIDPFRQNLTKEEIAIQITKNIRQSEGNYDALLGMVTNFNFTYNQDGGYDCTLKLMALGILGDATKINNPKDLPNILAEEIRNYNNTLSQIAAAQNTPPAEPPAPTSQQESILRVLNKEINSVDKEPTNEQKLIIAKRAGLPNAQQKLTGYYDNNIDYFYELKDRGWTWMIPRFGAIIPINDTADFVSSVNINTTNLFNTINSFFDSNKPPSNFQVGQTADPSNPVSTTALLQNQAALFYALPVEAKLFKTANLIQTSRGNTVDIRAKRFSYLGINGKKYPIGIELEFETINPSFTRDTVNSEEVYTKAINQIKADGSFNVSNFSLGVSTKKYAEIGEIDSTVNSVNSQGRLSFPILSLTKDVVVVVNDKIKQEVNNIGGSSVIDTTGDVSVNVRISLYITDSNLIQSVIKGAKAPDIKVVEATIAAQNQNQGPTAEEQAAAQEAANTQIQQALQLQSGLELTLRTIQVHALNKAIGASNNDLSIGRKVYQLPIWDPNDKTQGGTTFYSQIFSNGIFSNFIDQLIENKITDQNPVTPEERLRLQSKYGFATELMSGRASLEELSKKQVDFKRLLNAYVVPYEVSQEIVKGVTTNHPVYIPLGLLLMILNHNCTIYDTKDLKTQTPLVYIDFNPNLNFFLSNTKHLSTNPFKVLIPFEGSFTDYQELFSKEILTKDLTNIQPLSGSSENTPLFNTTNEDALSGQIPAIKFDETDSNIYRGKIMNVLISIDYAIELVRDYSLKDGTNSIYLKTFLEQIILDVNKYLGNFSLLRLAYNDAGNTFHIVDDQVTPTLSGEDMLQPDNISEIPLVGKFSIAKSLEIKTDISSKLSNMIAISANADVPGKSTLSSNGDNFGFINTSYRDRFIPIRGDVTGSNKENQDTVKAAAIQFNQTISDFYSKINPSDSNVSQATNYYIEKMSKIKNNEYPTRASAMIPVSVNFTTDGISGFTMGQSFTISDQLLPYTYNNRIVQNQKGLTKDHVNKVGFVVVGLTNTIENNQWTTAVRANMIFLKYKGDFVGSVKKLTNTSTEFGVNPNNLIVNNPVQAATGPTTLPDYIKNSEGYKNFIATTGVPERVQQIATKLGVTADDLYIVFYKESKFNSSVKNSIGAVGLIQFLPKTAAGLGVTTDQLQTMGPLKQLDYVEKYFGNNTFRNAYDLYLYVFFPAAVGKPLSSLIESKNQSAGIISRQNPAIATAAGKRPGDPLTVNDFYIYVQKSLLG